MSTEKFITQPISPIHNEPYPPLCFIILYLLFITYCIRWTYLIVTDPLRDVPGPLCTRFSRLWLFSQYCRGNYHEENVRLHQKYGPIVRIAPNEYSLDDPEAAKIVYGHGSRFNKSPWYIPFGHPRWFNLFNILDFHEHGLERRKLANAYAMSSLLTYEKFVDECNGLLMTRLSECAAAKLSVNMQWWFQCYAFDVVSMITFSQRLGLLDKGEDPDGFIKMLEESNFLASTGGVFPFAFSSLINLLVRLDMPPRALAILERYIEDQIQLHRQGRVDLKADAPVDFVNKLLSAQEGESSKISDLDLERAAFGNVFAGTDTTSISLSAILYNLCTHPAVLHKLRQELSEAQERGTISDPIAFREAQKLPYLQAVIKEGLRIHPATGFTMPRVVPKGGVNLCGRHFAERTVIGINSWVAHANQDVYGSDAQIFRPERWLEGGKSSSKMESYNLTFGQGSRTCIGKNISLLEISKLIPQIVREFDFVLENKGDSWQCTNNWFVKPKKFRCFIKRKLDTC